MTDLDILGLLVGILLIFAVILLWLVAKLGRRVEELERNTRRWEGEGKS